MKANGATNAIAAAIRKLWFATASKKRFRRTLAGSRLRTSGALIPTALTGPLLRDAPTAAS
jgi:hypothetical protein